MLVENFTQLRKNISTSNQPLDIMKKRPPSVASRLRAGLFKRCTTYSLLIGFILMSAMVGAQVTWTGPATGQTISSVAGTHHLIASGLVNPGTITSGGGCAGASSYSVPAVTGATFIWVVPAGWSIVSGQGTHSITVNANGNAIANQSV